MTANSRLDPNAEPAPTIEVDYMRKVSYRQAVGALLYLSRVSRPNISFAFQQIARHCESPRRSHWAAAKKVVCYLLQTRDLALRVHP